MVTSDLKPVNFNFQPPLLTQVVEYSNYVFIGIFTIEMLFKLLAEGFLMYIKDAFNVFDGFVVIMRLEVLLLIQIHLIT